MAHTPPPRLTGPPGIVVEGLTTILGGKPVLHDLRLTVPAGRTTVLMGPSGVGKTTLIRHIVGLRRPDAGTVLIDGHDVWGLRRQDLQELRRGIGSMLGGSNLFGTSVMSSYTAHQNLVLTLESLRVPGPEREARAEARLAELMLTEHRDQIPAQMPAHAVKRLALARALVTDGVLTVLDEIDLGLDAEHVDAMVAGLRTLRERTGGTLLLSTHDLGLARTVADHLAILVNGRIVAAGPPAEVLAGIESIEEFDRRFAFSDPVGPPRLVDAEAAVDRVGTRSVARGEPEPRRRIDVTALLLGILAVLLVAAVVAVLVVFAPGALSLR